jgi:hypothetical protein
MMAAIQALLDRARNYNEEARALASGAADLHRERQAIVAAFGELRIGKRKIAAELVRLDCRISDSASEVVPQKEEPEPPLLEQTRQSVAAADAQPSARMRMQGEPSPVLTMASNRRHSWIGVRRRSGISPPTPTPLIRRRRPGDRRLSLEMAGRLEADAWTATKARAFPGYLRDSPRLPL